MTTFMEKYYLGTPMVKVNGRLQPLISAVHTLKPHIFQIDKSNYQIINQFDLHSIPPIWPENPYLRNNTQTQTNKNYYYSATSEHPLVVDGITDKRIAKPISYTNWNWLDKFYFNQERQYRRYNLNNQLWLDGNRVVVRYSRGLLVYDVTNPKYPRLISRMNSEYITNIAIHGDYVYTSGPVYGFSIFKLPEVKP